MAGSLNRVQIIGNCAADPEVRDTGNGKVANLRIATSERWTDKNGEKKEQSEFHRVTVWAERLIPVIEQYVHKGSLLMIEGQLKTRKYQDQSGQEKYVTEIVLTQFRGEMLLLDKAGSGSTAAPASRPQTVARGGGSARSLGHDLNDSIPFVTSLDIAKKPDVV